MFYVHALKPAKCQGTGDALPSHFVLEVTSAQFK